MLFSIKYYKIVNDILDLHMHFICLLCKPIHQNMNKVLPSFIIKFLKNLLSFLGVFDQLQNLILHLFA